MLSDRRNPFDFMILFPGEFLRNSEQCLEFLQMNKFLFYPTRDELLLRCRCRE